MKWKAQWIWHPGSAGEPNQYVFFRKDFAYPGAGKGAALLRVTAGHFYRLYLNGRPVGRGPDRCYFRDKIYHTYDVSRLLRKGRNVLAVHCHFLGQGQKNLMERHAEGPAGLLAQLDVKGKPVAWTDGAWKSSVDAAYETKTEPASMHREWREEFYASRQAQGWTGAAFDDSAWAQAAVVAPAEGGPWTRLIAKDTPEMTAEAIAPLNVYVTNPGGNAPPDYEGYLFYNMISAKPERAAGDVSFSNAHQDRQEILFDMGRVVAGYPRIEIADSCGGTLEVYYGDSLNLTHWDTVHLGRGPLTWAPFTTRGGRYVKLVLTGARNPVKLRSVRWIRTNYPVEHRGRFSCDEPRLNAIWDACALSAETCGMEHFVDCVGREQVLWMMDFRFQAPQHYYYFGDTALARKCFRQYATLQLDNGHILAYGPSCRAKETLLNGPEGLRRAYDWLNFNFWFVVAAWEYFEYTGDRAFLREMYPVCRRVLEYYRRSERDGFAGCGEVEGYDHIDWGYEGYRRSRRSVYSFTQAMYYGALQAQRRIAAALGETSAAAALDRHAGQVEERYFSAFIDPRTARVADCLVEGKRVDAGCAHPHAAMLRFMDHIPDAVRRRSLGLLARGRLKPARTGVGVTLTAEALCRHNEIEAAVRLIRGYYGAILDAGLKQTPEFFDVNGPRGADSRWQPAYSRCHSYASMAGALLQRHVLGVTVRGARAEVSPWFGPFDRASGTVPTRAGDVSVEWKREDGAIHLLVEAPRGVGVKYVPRSDDEPVICNLM